MKGATLIKKIIVSSGFLAIIPSILIVMVLPSLGSKHTLSVTPPTKYLGQVIYTDLNSDTISEIVYTGKGSPYFYIAAKSYDFHIFDQWNLSDSLDPNISGIFTGNFDKDRFQEIYVFSHNTDSLFLNINEFLEIGGTKFDRVFITKIGYVKGEVSSVLKPAGFFDANGDGFDELYFSITTGYGREPRKLYFYDLVEKSLRSSQFTGSIVLDPVMQDIDGDKRPEIFGVMSASGNYTRAIPYADSSTWFMVFDDQLVFEFPPVEFPGFANGLYIHGYDNGSTKGYLLSHWKGGTDPSVMKSQIMIYTSAGKFVRSRLFSDFGSSEYSQIYINHDNRGEKIFVLSDKLVELNDKLDIIRTVRLPFSTKFVSFEVDLNNDFEDEFLLYSEDEENLAVYDSDFQKLDELKFHPPSDSWSFSHYYSGDHQSKLFLFAGNSGYFISLKNNNFYYLGYLAYSGIYLLILLFIVLIKKINTYQVVEKESLNRRLTALQLQGIKAQLDPHFTFNTLNSVASLIYLDDRQAAYDYMNKFTQLLRGMLNDAERIYRSLAEEIEFVTTYLDLEKLRFGDKFNYSIEIGEGVTQREQVPKLVLHTFSENAVKHGLMPRSDCGTLKIIITREGDYLKLIIEDNGIGRKKSAGKSTSTGKGLKLTAEFYGILNQMNKKPIKHTITDLYNGAGEPLGTRVKVWVPAEVRV